MSDSTSHETEHLDEATLNELEALLEDDFADLIDTYLTDSKVRYQDLSQAVATKVADDIRQAAHSFKGSSLNIGAVQLSALCKRMEDHAREGRTLYATELLKDIDEELNVVDRLLRQRYL